jgi:hypothetical protein
MPQVKGSFEVKGTPHPPSAAPDALSVLRMTFHKTFHGDLQGSSVVEMLGTMNKELGSGAYVAIECLTVTLAGHSGSFYLHHSSTMTRGKPAQQIAVVPDSGSGGLAGLRGAMTIDIVEGRHFYVFDYELPAVPAAKVPPHSRRPRRLRASPTVILSFGSSLPPEPLPLPLPLPTNLSLSCLKSSLKVVIDP